MKKTQLITLILSLGLVTAVTIQPAVAKGGHHGGSHHLNSILYELVKGGGHHSRGGQHHRGGEHHRRGEHGQRHEDHHNRWFFVTDRFFPRDRHHARGEKHHSNGQHHNGVFHR